MSNNNLNNKNRKNRRLKSLLDNSNNRLFYSNDDLNLLNSNKNLFEESSIKKYYLFEDDSRNKSFLAKLEREEKENEERILQREREYRDRLELEKLEKEKMELEREKEEIERLTILERFELERLEREKLELEKLELEKLEREIEEKNKENKYILDENNNKSNLPITLSNMNNNKLIRRLDSVYLDDENKNNEENDKLLRFILEEADKDFFKHYNTPYISGLLTDFPKLIDDEDNLQIKKSIPKEEVLIDASIDNLLDLINLCDKYPLSDSIEYNINMKALHKIKPSLIDLQNMIGMQSIKENIVDQIIYFLQGLHNVSSNDSDYLHAVIYGPPGTGKTEVAKIMGNIFSKLGILKNNVFKKVTRDDLVAGYLGQTALKTKDVIKECLGGVLFIDEAYALGNKEKRDSFSKESIDTICEALSDHKKDLMCIIAGYEQELKDCFFSYNPGLESRFTWKFNVDEYSPSEMRLIFEKKIKDSGWNIDKEFENEWFEKNKACFPFYGRDMETLFSKVKIAHSRRVFCLSKEEKTRITFKDLEKGFAIYEKMGSHEKKREEEERKKQLYNTLYC